MNSKQHELVTRWAQSIAHTQLRVFRAIPGTGLFVCAMDTATMNGLEIKQFLYPNRSPQTLSRLTYTTDAFEPTCQLVHTVMARKPLLYIMSAGVSRFATLFIPSDRTDTSEIASHSWTVIQNRRFYALSPIERQRQIIDKFVPRTNAYTCCVLARHLLRKFSEKDLPQTLALLRRLNKQQLVDVFGDPYQALLQAVPDDQIGNVMACIYYLIKNARLFHFLPSASTKLSLEDWIRSCKVGKNYREFPVKPRDNYLVGYRLRTQPPGDLVKWEYPSADPIAFTPTDTPDSNEPDCLGVWVPVNDAPVMYRWKGWALLFLPFNNPDMTDYQKVVRHWRENARLTVLIRNEPSIKLILTITNNTLPYTSFKLAQVMLSRTHDIARAIERIAEADLSVFNIPDSYLEIAKENAVKLLEAGCVSDPENASLRDFLRRR